MDEKMVSFICHEADMTRLERANKRLFVVVEKKGIENVFPVIDELMETLYVINPPLYDSVMRKIE